MKYKKIFLDLTQLHEKDLKTLEELGLVHSMQCDEHERAGRLVSEYEDLRTNISDVKGDYNRTGERECVLRRRSNSMWHRFWTGKETLEAEKTELAAASAENAKSEKRFNHVSTKLYEIREIFFDRYRGAQFFHKIGQPLETHEPGKQDNCFESELYECVDESPTKICGTLIKNKNDFSPRKFIERYFQTVRGDYVARSGLGDAVLRRLDDIKRHAEYEISYAKRAASKGCHQSEVFQMMAYHPQRLLSELTYGDFDLEFLKGRIGGLDPITLEEREAGDEWRNYGYSRNH